MNSALHTRARDTAQELLLTHSDECGEVVFHGTSMLPSLREGDRIIAQPVAWDDISIGDIITYRNEDKFPTYRVMSKTADTLFLKPDNWPLVVVVRQEAVLGRVIKRIRGNAAITPQSPSWALYRSVALIRWQLGRLSARAGAILRKR